MTEHTSEAQAAYPGHHDSIWTREITLNLRTAFDRGRASMVETVTTEAELEALPVGSVIRTSGSGLGGWGPSRVAEKVADADGSLSLRRGKWQVADGDEFEVDSDELDDLPARVLFRPDREEGNG